MKLKSLLAVVAGAAFAVCASADTWYADASKDAGTGDGTSPETAFHTIQEAIDAASAEDTIKVLPGVYDQGATNVWRTTYNATFWQQSRVYVTKKLTIVSTDGRERTTIRGSFGTCGDKDNDPGNLHYRTNGITCMVVADAAAGTVIRGFGFEEGYAHQSAAPEHVAAGGLCAYTPGSANAFLVTDSSFTHCYGRGGGCLHGGTAIRCVFKNGLTGWRGCSAYESRLYNCLSLDSNYDGTGLTTWDFCDVIAINCTVFNNFGRGGFWRSSGTGFGGTHYNCLCYGNTYSSTWSNLAGYSRGTSVNSLSDDRYQSDVAAVVDNADATQVPQFCLSPWTRDFRPVKGGLIDGKGDRQYLTAAGDDFVIPADEINRDFNGDAIAAAAPLPIGIVLPAVEPQTGLLTVSSILSLDGHDMALSKAFVRGGRYPMEVRIAMSGRQIARGEKRVLMALGQGASVWYFGQYDSLVQLMPKVGAEIAWGTWYSAAELYVGGDNANDGNAGTADAPLATIQKAVDKAVGRLDEGSGGKAVQTVIHVRPGTYGCQTGTYANEPGDFDTNAGNTGLRSSINVPAGKNILVRSTGGAAVTFIEGAPDPDTKGCGPNATRCLAIDNSANAAFSGFTFRHGYAYNNDTVTDKDYSYGAAVQCGGNTYQHIYDSVFTDNHGRGVVNKGLYARCLFTGNTNVASCVVMGNGGQVTLTACVFLDNSKQQGGNGSYILYNNANTFHCSLHESLCDENCKLQNINGKIVNCAYETKNGKLTNFSAGYKPIVGSVITARTQEAQTYPEAMKYADPYFTSPWTGDFRLQRPSEAVGYGMTSDPNGIIPDTDFTTYLHGDYQNRNLVHDDGTINAGAFAEDLAEGLSDVFADAVNGNDANDGRSEATAMKTLAAAVQVRVPGNAKIIALPGHYNEGSALHVGNSFKPANGTAGSVVRANPTVASRVVVPAGRTLVAKEGPEVTFIEGAADPDSTDTYGRGPKAIRCVFLEKDAVVRGFTIRYGHTDYYAGKNSGEDSYQDDFYGAGVFGRSLHTDASGKLNGTRVEHCILTENYADLGGAGGITSFHNCRVTKNYGVNYGGFFRHGACYNCYVDDCHGKRVCDVIYDCINCTFDAKNGDVNNSTTPPFENIQSSMRLWNFLLLQGTAANVKLGSNVRNVVIASELTPTYDGTHENVYNDRTMNELRAMFTDGVANGRSAPTVDTGCADALALLDGFDAVGAPRVRNGQIDIGAYEYDWTGDYAKALGRKVTVTDEKGAVETEAGKVTLPNGATLTADWTGRDGMETDFKVAFTLSGTGKLTVFLNGEKFGEYTASGNVLFGNGELVNQLTFAYEGDGSASIDSMRRLIGSSVIIR